MAVSDYATFAVPALLQTREYSLGATVGGSRVRPDHAERVVGLRMDRQRRLDSEGDPLRLLALIEESVLDRPIGGPAVLRRQLEHLISQSDRDNVEIRMVPTSVGPHDAGAGPFKLLDFAQAQSITYVEVSPTCGGMALRHSKIPNSPVISFTGEQWAHWLGEVVSGHLSNTNGAVTVLVHPASWTVREAATGTELVFDEQEWTAFWLGAKDGEFDPSVIEQSA